jgi:Cu/Ag efflux protein CusF
VKTLEDVVDHYSAGGRTIKKGPNAGAGADNPNKSEFVKRVDLTAQEKADLVAFLKSLTDRDVLTDPRLSNPWTPAVTRNVSAKPRYTLHGQVVRVYADDGTVMLYHDEIPGLMKAMKAPYAMEFLVANREQLKALKPGQAISASVRRQGSDFVLDDVRPASGGAQRSGSDVR